MDKTGSRPLNRLIRGFQDADKQLFVAIIYLPDNGHYDFQNISVLRVSCMKANVVVFLLESLFRVILLYMLRNSLEILKYVFIRTA